MPDGQGGGGAINRAFIAQYNHNLERVERELREAREQRMQRQWEARSAQSIQDFYNNPVDHIHPGETVHVEPGTYMAGGSFTVSGDWLDPSPFWNENPYISSPPKPKRSTRPVSAIFYPMVNECGY